jgi:hypothetical protein
MGVQKPTASPSACGQKLVSPAFLPSGLQDNKASYTATRFSLDSSGQLDGNYTYTERLLDNQDSQFANAGSFCTKDLVVGVAARGQRPPAGVEAAGPELVVPAGSAVYASFFSYGLGQSERRQDDGNLPKMPMVS